MTTNKGKEYVPIWRQRGVRDKLVHHGLPILNLEISCVNPANANNLDFMWNVQSSWYIEVRDISFKFWLLSFQTTQVFLILREFSSNNQSSIGGRKNKKLFATSLWTVPTLRNRNFQFGNSPPCFYFFCNPAKDLILAHLKREHGWVLIFSSWIRKASFSRV